MLRWISVVVFAVAVALALLGPTAEVLPNMSTSTTTAKLSRTVAKAILSREQGEGMGARVRRSIGSGQLRNLDPFLMLDEFAVQAPAGFPDHPHRGFETVTYMMEGTMAHEDFAGHAGTIGPGDLQWMTAGKGIVHAEMPQGSQECRGLQLWVNLPRAEKLCEPRYQELLDRDIPRVKPKPGVEIKVIAGESFGIKSPVYTKAPTIYLDFRMDANQSIQQTLPASFNAFAYLLQGKAKFGSGAGSQLMDAHHTLVLTRSEEQDHVSIETGAEPAHFVLIAGKPNEEPIVQHGPFVMTTREEIAQTFEDYQRAANGFEKAAHWHSSIANES